MRAILAALLALGTILTSQTATAQEPPPPQEGYSLQPATGEYLKIDRRTGDVSLCASRSGGWSCELIADDRKAYEDRIAELEAENERLGKRIAALEADGTRTPLLGQDDERRLQEFFDLSDRMFRHFFDLVGRLRERDEAPI
ncbi:hypothetical protein CXZ10_20645 [Pleomorphomonas diazotrophica]|uniref:Uncharacterized protein n=1 Tax=Pleomorphomonas diazotrophica TaxID=1166257 RepID=A0A1I4TFA7_9HYPH|nr:hypothetical protein [Pleomorphomonas diazotrophica]PKR87216.1 hypothetical protein CXZ10_20645 [Pleomorphomonas diazotrophica]SFM75331.1 hypothetical protein SAMN05192571_105215 [Pleomorphomonas diazotrophica]